MTMTEGRPEADTTSSTAAPPAPSAFEAAAAAVDDARAGVDALDDGPQRAAIELQTAIESFHRPALVHIVQTLKADPRGKELLFELVDDPGVRAVFALHGIIRADPMTRAQQALDGVRPYLQSHGGDVELVEIDGDTAVVRLMGSCNGCSMSAVTLRDGVEEALVQGVEEIVGVRVLEDEPTAAFIPLGSVGRRSPDAGWTAGPAVDDLAEGGMVRFDHGDESFVITHVDSRLAVFRNECVHQGLSLDGGLMSEGVITCPWHGFTFDATSGECISAPGAQLQQVPARVDEGTLWIRAGGG
jgi:Fe-S cluster biogenesis protein NfuA/nitrite reductase/ring-hydroxylating ferredoxin subunit